MTTLADDLVPTSCGRSSSPCCRPRHARPTAAGTAPSPTGRVWPRSCTWPGPRPRGGSCPPGSWAAARRRPAGGASPSGPMPASSSSSTFRSWTAWASRASWTGSRRPWTPGACAPNAGGPCGRKSRRSWQGWKQAPPGLRRWRGAAERGGDRRQRQRHHHVPGRRGGYSPIRTPAGRRRTDRPRFTLTRAMTAEPTGPTCGGVGSRRGSLGVRSSRRPGLDATAGRSSGRCRG
jgi:hypothetical protein